METKKTTYVFAPNKRAFNGSTEKFKLSETIKRKEGDVAIVYVDCENFKFHHFDISKELNSYGKDDIPNVLHIEKRDILKIHDDIKIIALPRIHFRYVMIAA